jgi:hypothetical protein
MRRFVPWLSCFSLLLLALHARAQSPILGAPTQPPITPQAQHQPPVPGTQGDNELTRLQQSVDQLRKQQAAVRAVVQPDDKLKQQVDLLQKQIEIQQKMISLLIEQMKKQPAAGPAVDKLETQVITLDARSKQAAQRDVELAQAIDKIVEHQDAIERYGPNLPSPLRELFLPSNTQETVLSIYGALAFGYSRILGDSTTSAQGITGPRPSTPGGFYFGEFTPDFLLKLNDWIFLEAEIGVAGDGSVGVGSFAQADFFINDWLTLIGGRFVAPIGWFNERLNNPWINKLPGDAPGSGPLLWSQVLPPLSILGVQAQGAFYLCGSPIKMEYNAYFGNGMNFTPATPLAPTLSELANLQNMTDTFSFVSNERCVGGRLGLWWPEVGVAGGLSGLYNGDYVGGGFENAISIWALDLNYHKGNWDARFEYGQTYQQATNFLGTNIRRAGFYGQVTYRPRDCANRFLENLEGVYRFSYVDFKGIDPTQLDLSSFGTPMDVPVRRYQHEIGINYWLAQRCVIKFAFQRNIEPGFALHDNQFITEFAWGW